MMVEVVDGGGEMKKGCSIQIYSTPPIVFMKILEEMIEESGITRECRFLLTLYLNLEGDDSLADTMDIGNVGECGNHAYALSAQHGLSEFHLVHTIVDHHFKVVDLNGLFPKVREEAERQVSMSDGLSEGAILGTFGINVYPLMVERGISKHVDALLRNFEPIGDSEGFAYV